MTQSQQCGSLIRNRKHVKRVVVVGCCLGIAIILLNTDDLFKEYRNSQLKVETLTGPRRHIWMKLMSLRMEERRKKLQENCELLQLNSRGNDSLHRPNEWEFLVNRRFRLIWCNVFKAASTSWMYNFNILAGYKADFLKNTKEVPLQLARKKYPRPSLKYLEAALNDSTSFLIVRHPFERLLSGYRDKIEFALPNTYHYKLGNYIIMKYREKLEKKVEKTPLFDYLKTHPKRPTFFEFVEFVINLYESGKPLDMHWTPITTFCTPCQVRFDIIMKFETLQEDQIYLIYKKNLESWIKPQWKNPTKEHKSVVSLLKSYYTQLNPSQIYQLYNIYRYDFHLFDYTLDDYLKYLNFNQAILNEQNVFL